MKPILQALVLADKVYTDVSGKKIIAGTFNGYTITKAVVPKQQSTPDGKQSITMVGGSDPGCPSLYVSLTDVVDGTEIDLKFHNVSRDEQLFERSKIRINCNDRLSTVEIVLPLPALHRIANAVGVYSLDLYWKDDLLGSHRITVRESAPPPSKD